LTASAGAARYDQNINFTLVVGRIGAGGAADTWDDREAGEAVWRQRRAWLRRAQPLTSGSPVARCRRQSRESSPSRCQGRINKAAVVVTVTAAELGTFKGIS
jgi:hypothetical protein